MRLGWTTWAVGLGVALVVGLGAGSDAAAADDVRLHGYVMEKNVAEQTVLVGDRIYHVDARTELAGLGGRRIELSELPTIRDLDTGQEEPGAVIIEAQQIGGRWRLSRLSMVEAVPR